MTLEQKNLIIGFIEISEINKDLRGFEMIVRGQVSEIIDLLPKENIKKGLKLEGNLLKLLELIKWNYFEYGASTEETLDSWRLNWTPEGLKKGSEENDN